MPQPHLPIGNTVTYLSAASLADNANLRASRAAAKAEDPGVAELSRSMAVLAQAVAEMARSAHRES